MFTKTKAKAKNSKTKHDKEEKLRFGDVNSHAWTFNTFRKIGLFPFRFDPINGILTHDRSGKYYWLFIFNTLLIYFSLFFDCFRVYHFLHVENETWTSKPEYIAALLLWIMCELFSVSVFTIYYQNADNLCNLFTKWSRFECAVAEDFPHLKQIPSSQKSLWKIFISMGSLSVLSVVNNHLQHPRIGLFVYSFFPIGFESTLLKLILTFYEGYLIVLFWYGGGGGFDILFGGLSISLSKCLEATTQVPCKSLNQLKKHMQRFKEITILKTQINECFSSLLLYQKLIVMIVLCYLADNQIRNGSRIPFDEASIFWGNFLFVSMRVRTWRVFAYISESSKEFLKYWDQELSTLNLPRKYYLEILQVMRCLRPISFTSRNFYDITTTTVLSFSKTTAENVITVCQF